MISTVYYRDAACAILVYDVTAPKSLPSLDRFVADLNMHTAAEGKPLIPVVRSALFCSFVSAGTPAPLPGPVRTGIGLAR